MIKPKDIFNFINLHNGEERKEKVLENVKSNISFRGSNLWILACAIIVASIGLNVNSTAVIIGAMLISPLMGPIVGAGFALAIYDFQLLKRSGKNLLIATIVSLSVAFFYFFLSPFKDIQSELLARTSPNIYDVLIAFFGGLVGVIALTRVEKGNPIPGVAIATALMPPLCTAGYGLAVGNFAYFSGAFYLYLINCFFIGVATFLIIKFLKYPPVKTLNPQFDRKIRIIISTLTFVLIVPGLWLAYTLFEEKKFVQKTEYFIEDEFNKKGLTIIYKNLKFKGNPKKIELAFLDKKFTKNEIKSLNDKLLSYEIKNTEIVVKQDSSDFNEELKALIENQKKQEKNHNNNLEKLQNELQLFKINEQDVSKEIAILFPEFKNIALSVYPTKVNQDSSFSVLLITFQSSNLVDQNKHNTLKNWLKMKLNVDSVALANYYK
jgi:uncharacterized hydrophobic protein (TIGR00271 family)